MNDDASEFFRVHSSLEVPVDVKAVTEMIETYVRPATFPVGIKMLKPGEALPPKTRTPADLGSRFATCQTINVVRRYGWSIGLSADHHSCPLGLVALGFKPNVEYLQEGHACEGMYTASLAAGARTEAEAPKFALGQYASLFVSPLKNHPFDLWKFSASDAACTGGAVQTRRISAFIL
jgi:uncharacterized protein (DUF169 family)